MMWSLDTKCPLCSIVSVPNCTPNTRQAGGSHRSVPPTTEPSPAHEEAPVPSRREGCPLPTAVMPEGLCTHPDRTWCALKACGFCPSVIPQYGCLTAGFFAHMSGAPALRGDRCSITVPGMKEGADGFTRANTAPRLRELGGG